MIGPTANPIRTRLALAIMPMLLAGSCGQPTTVENQPAAADQHDNPTTRTAVSLASISDGALHDLPGVHHVLVQTPGVLSGGVPEGDEGFASLAAIGVRTVISVDAAPVDLDAARAHGLRYVQIPVEYAGISTEAATQLAVALRDVEGPVFIHCHHGQHRGPAAAALALVETGQLTNGQALAQLTAAGTSPNYPGLFRCVQQATPYTPEALASLSASLPERARVSSMAGGMAVIDRGVERLALVQGNDWRVPNDHPDLSPVALAATVEANLRALAHLPGGGMTPPIQSTPRREAFIESMRESAEHASRLESALAGTDWLAASTAWSNLKNSCTSCHTAYRNNP